MTFTREMVDAVAAKVTAAGIRGKLRLGMKEGWLNCEWRHGLRKARRKIDLGAAAMARFPVEFVATEILSWLAQFDAATDAEYEVVIEGNKETN